MKTLLQEVNQLKKDHDELKDMIKDGLYKPWKPVGRMKDLETLLQTYPLFRIRVWPCIQHSQYKLQS